VLNSMGPEGVLALLLICVIVGVISGAFIAIITK